MEFGGQDLIFGRHMAQCHLARRHFVRAGEVLGTRGACYRARTTAGVIMIQSQGTFIFIAATVAVLVTVAAVVILQVRSRKRGPK